MGKWIFLCLLGVGIYWWWPRPARYPAVYIPEEPRQENLAISKEWDYQGIHFKSLASYEIKALVLGAARYRFDPMAKWFPVDLALGWGPMSKASVLEQLSISQSGRWFEYSWSGAPPLAEREINSHSSNTHMIPATKAIEKILLRVRAGDVIIAKGKLVSLQLPNKIEYKSSLTRDDTKGGACEIMWVEELNWESLAGH